MKKLCGMNISATDVDPEYEASAVPAVPSELGHSPIYLTKRNGGQSRRRTSGGRAVARPTHLMHRLGIFLEAPLSDP